MTDDDLIAHRLRTGEAGALETLELLYRRHARTLRRDLAASFQLDEATAKRIVNVTLDAIPQHAAAFYRGVRDAGGIHAYLRSLCGMAATEVRRYRSMKPLGLDDPSRGFAESAFKAGLQVARRRRALSAI